MLLKIQKFEEAFGRKPTKNGQHKNPIDENSKLLT